MKKIFISLLVVVIMVVVTTPRICFAEEPGVEAPPLDAPTPTAPSSNNSGGSVQIKDPLNLPGGTAAIPKLANNLISVALGLSGVLALIAFIYGGIMYLLAGIDAKNVQKGKDAMKWAVIGLFLIFSSYAIVYFLLSDVLGIK
jgi:hypothetical protein